MNQLSKSCSSDFLVPKSPTSPVFNIDLTSDFRQRLIETQLRNTQSKLVSALKNHQDEQYKDLVSNLVNLDCLLLWKYRVLSIVQLFKTDLHTFSDIKELSAGLNILSKYGLNLLSAIRPVNWRTVPLTKGRLHHRLGKIKSAVNILKQFGYVEELQHGLSFPDNEEPNPSKVAKLTGELMLATEELNAYYEGRHPVTSRLEEFIPESARRNPNQPLNIEIEHSTVVNNEDTKTESNQVNSLSSNNSNDNSFIHPGAVDISGELKKLPLSVELISIQQSAQFENRSPMDSSPSSKSSRSSYSSFFEQKIKTRSFSEPELTCSICGVKATQKCLTCKLNFCVEDDNRWHNHPTRQNHARQPHGEQEGYNAEKLRELMKQQSAKLDELMQRCKKHLEKPETTNGLSSPKSPHNITEDHPIPPPRYKKKARQSLQSSPVESPLIPPRARTYSGNATILGLRPSTIKSLQNAHNAHTKNLNKDSVVLRRNNSTTSLNNNYYSTIVYSDANAKKETLCKSENKAFNSTNAAQNKNNRHSIHSSHIPTNKSNSENLNRSSSSSSLSNPSALQSSVKTTKIETMTSTSAAVSSSSVSTIVSKPEPAASSSYPIYAVPSKIKQEINHPVVTSSMQVAKTTTASTQTNKKAIKAETGKSPLTIPVAVLELGSNQALKNISQGDESEYNQNSTSYSTPKKLSKKAQILEDIMKIEEPSERCRELELCIAKLDKEILFIQEQIAKLVKSLVRSDAIHDGTVKTLIEERDCLINVLEELLEYRQYLYTKESIEHRMRMQEIEKRYSKPAVQPTSKMSYIPPTTLPDWDKSLATVGLQSPGFCTLPPGFATFSKDVSPVGIFSSHVGLAKGREDYSSNQQSLPSQMQMFPLPSAKQYYKCPYCRNDSVFGNFCYSCKIYLPSNYIEENSQFCLMQPPFGSFSFPNVGIGHSEELMFQRRVLGNLPVNNSVVYSAQATSKFNLENSHQIPLTPETLGSSPSSEEYYSAEDDRENATRRSRTLGDVTSRLGQIKNSGKTQRWRCQHCTFINEPKSHICEMCYKTNDEILDNITCLTAKKKDISEDCSYRKDRMNEQQVAGKKYAEDSKEADKEDIFVMEDISPSQAEVIIYDVPEEKIVPALKPIETGEKQSAVDDKKSNIYDVPEQVTNNLSQSVISPDFQPLSLSNGHNARKLETNNSLTVSIPEMQNEYLNNSKMEKSSLEIISPVMEKSSPEIISPVTMRPKSSNHSNTLNIPRPKPPKPPRLSLTLGRGESLSLKSSPVSSPPPLSPNANDNLLKPSRPVVRSSSLRTSDTSSPSRDEEKSAAFRSSSLERSKSLRLACPTSNISQKKTQFITKTIPKRKAPPPPLSALLKPPEKTPINSPSSPGSSPTSRPLFPPPPPPDKKSLKPPRPTSPPSRLPCSSLPKPNIISSQPKSPTKLLSKSLPPSRPRSPPPPRPISPLSASPLTSQIINSSPEKTVSQVSSIQTMTSNSLQSSPLPPPPSIPLPSPPVYHSIPMVTQKSEKLETQNEKQPTVKNENKKVLDEKKKVQLMSDGLEMVRIFRDFEMYYHHPDDIQIAVLHCGEKGPLKWLQDNWKTMINDVAVKATEEGGDLPVNTVGKITIPEAADALRLHKGDFKKAVKECIETRQKRVSSIKSKGPYLLKRVLEVLEQCEGSGTEALIILQQEALEALFEHEQSDVSVPSNDSSDVINIISERKTDPEHASRTLLAEEIVQSYEKAETTIKLIDLKFDTATAITVADTCSSLELAISYLEQECGLCFIKVPMTKMIYMLNCTHRACSECIRDYFTIQIKDRNIMEMVCPYCNEPDLNDEDIAHDYFSNMGQILKTVLDPSVYELFERKLLDRTLMKDPNFRWCSKCSSGFIGDPQEIMFICPHCENKTCGQCRKAWESQHEGLSCELFQQWKEENDPEYQIAGLARHLSENGIDCPKCNHRYSLAKGGCMHFKCIVCTFEFCSGCKRPFFPGKKCKISQKCKKLGLHAHHPRNCLFFLRDREPDELKQLLKDNNIPFNTEVPEWATTPSLIVEIDHRCRVFIQKETPSGMQDDFCRREAPDEFSGLCRNHYIEYLVGLIIKHNIDPAVIFCIADLSNVLIRAEKEVPIQDEDEDDENYRTRILQLVQQELPLEESLLPH